MSIDGINAMPPMTGPPRMKPPSAVDMGSEIMSAKDTDGDGALSSSEANLSNATFVTLDTNDDGAISQDELISKLTEKLEEMKEKLDSGGMRPNGPPPPGGPPPQEQTDATEELTEIERLLELMNAVGTSQSDSDQSGLDMYTTVLENLGMGKEEQSAFFDLVQDNGMDILA